MVVEFPRIGAYKNYRQIDALVTLNDIMLNHHRHLKLLIAWTLLCDIFFGPIY